MKLAMTAAGFSVGVRAGAGWDGSSREQSEGTSRLSLAISRYPLWPPELSTLEVELPAEGSGGL